MTTTRIQVGTPDDGPYALTSDHQGRIWASMVHSGRLCRLDPTTITAATGDTTSAAAAGVEFLDLGAPASQPTQLAVDAAGALWCTRYGDDHLERIDPDTLDHHSVLLPPGTQPYGIATTAHGIWFTAIGREAVGHTTPDSAPGAAPHNEVSFVELPEPGMPAMITRGGDGGLWFTIHHLGSVARLDPDTTTITIHRLPDPDGGPVGISADPDGLWCPQIRSGRLARLRWDGTVTEYDLAERDGRPHAATPAGDGGCWVSVWGSSHLVRVHPDGTNHTVDVLDPDDHPHGLLRLDERIWVATDQGDLIAIPA